MKRINIQDEGSGKKGRDSIKSELVVDKDALPLVIVYKEKRYVLILTQNDKLILNKYAE